MPSRKPSAPLRKRLPEYEAKRDFAITKEPAPGNEPAPGPPAAHAVPTFVVHKHDATRLHYGAGDLLIWDNGTCESVPTGQLSQQRKKGHIVVAFSGHKLNGQWHLVRTHGGAPGKAQWLMFKAKDGTENAAFDVVSASFPSSSSTTGIGRCARSPIAGWRCGRPTRWT